MTKARAHGRGRIAIVRQTDHYELPVRREAEALHGAGFDVEVLLMRSEASPTQETVDGVELTYLRAQLSKAHKLSYAIGYARFFLAVAVTLTRRQLRRRYVAVQVNTMPDALVFAALGPKLLGARVVAYMHEPMPELAQTVFGPGAIPRVLAWIEQLVLRFADYAITVTDELKARYVERGADPARIGVVLNGADPEDLLGSWTPPEQVEGDGTFTVICHGTVEDRYGQDTIVDAAGLLRDELADLRVVLVGRGKRVDELRRKIADEGLEDVVSWEGWVTLERLNDLLHAADVGVVAQKASEYSHLVHTNKMVDYWIFGLPVIASRLRAVSAVYDESTLEYYEPGDPADLARAIRRLYSDPARRAELSRNGRIAQETYGWSVQRVRYLAAFDALLAP